MSLPTREIRFVSPRFQVVRLTYAGPQDRPVTREFIEHPGAVVILPLVDANHICLIRNYRAAVGQTLWELPAGTLEPGENPAHTARRELEEETGYRAGVLEPGLQFWMSPGILSERMHLFVARQLVPGPQRLEAGEEITTVVVDWPTALGMIDQGQIQDAKSLVGLLWQARAAGNHPRGG